MSTKTLVCLTRINPRTGKEQSIAIRADLFGTLVDRGEYTSVAVYTDTLCDREFVKETIPEIIAAHEAALRKDIPFASPREHGWPPPIRLEPIYGDTGTPPPGDCAGSEENRRRA